jgi:hypothetical protein
MALIATNPDIFGAKITLFRIVRLARQTRGLCEPTHQHGALDLLNQKAC